MLLVAEENGKLRKVLKRAIEEELTSLNVLCTAHNDTVSYLSRLADTCCQIYSACTRRYLLSPQQSQLSQVPLLPKIKPPKAWMAGWALIDHTHTHASAHTHTQTHFPFLHLFAIHFSVICLSKPLFPLSLSTGGSLLPVFNATGAQASCNIS